MKVSSWHGGQLAVAWIGGLLCVALMLGGLHFWHARFIERSDAADASLKELLQDNDAKAKQAIDSLPPALANAELARLTSRQNEMLLAQMKAVDETFDHMNLKRILAPVAWVTSGAVMLFLLVASWHWFGSRRRAL